MTSVINYEILKLQIKRIGCGALSSSAGIEGPPPSGDSNNPSFNQRVMKNISLWCAQIILPLRSRSQTKRCSSLMALTGCVFCLSVTLN